MNKIIGLLLAFIILPVLAKDELTKKIPSSSLFVASLETSNLLGKLDMLTITNLEMMVDMKSQLKKETKKDSNIVDQLFKDPAAYGLYFQPSSYVYLDYENTSNPIPSVGVLIPLKTGKKLEKLIIS